VKFKDSRGCLKKSLDLMSNVLVHNYVYMTPKELYANIRSLVVPLARIMNSILSYMQEKNIDP
jgi:uncharacterized protein with HEPN domain